MVTAQSIQDVRFTSAMSGYKKAEVDAFLDQCAATVEELNATVEENTRKMQVLAETIVEYRNQEDSIRTAVLGAQRMSDSVIAEANEKAQTIITEATEKAAAILAEAEDKAAHIAEESQKSIRDELDELARIQKEVAAFRSRLLAAYREHLTLIGILNDDEKDVSVTEEPVKEAVPTEEIAEQEIVSAEQTVPADEVKLDISAFELPDEE